jgi:ACR3 family arsenite efflux pump ArsB
MSEDTPDRKNRPTFNYRAVVIGAAISPLSFWLLHGVATINTDVVAGSILTILAMALASVLIWDVNARGRDAERRRKTSLAFDAFVNVIFGHGIAFVLIRFLAQIIQRFT